MIDLCPMCHSPKLLREVREGSAMGGGDLYFYHCNECGIEFTLDQESPEAVREMAEALEDFLAEYRQRA